MTPRTKAPQLTARDHYERSVWANDDLTGTPLFVALVLGTVLDERGEVEVAASELCRVTGRTRRTVQRAIRALEDHEVLIVERHRSRPHRYIAAVTR